MSDRQLAGDWGAARRTAVAPELQTCRAAQNVCSSCYCKLLVTRALVLAWPESRADDSLFLSVRNTVHYVQHYTVPALLTDIITAQRLYTEGLLVP